MPDRNDPTYVTIKATDDDLYLRGLPGRDPNTSDGGQSFKGSVQVERDGTIAAISGTMVTAHDRADPKTGAYLGPQMNERAAKGVLDVSLGTVRDDGLRLRDIPFDLTTYHAGVVGVDDTTVTSAIQNGWHDATRTLFGGRSVQGEYDASSAKNGPHAGVVVSGEASTTQPVTHGVEARLGAFANGEAFVNEQGVQGLAAGGGARISIGRNIASQPLPIPMANGEGFIPSHAKSPDTQRRGDWAVTASIQATGFMKNRFYDAMPATVIPPSLPPAAQLGTLASAPPLPAGAYVALPSRPPSPSALPPAKSETIIPGARHLVKQIGLDGSFALSRSVALTAEASIADNPSTAPDHGLPLGGAKSPNVNAGVGVRIRF